MKVSVVVDKTTASWDEVIVTLLHAGMDTVETDGCIWTADRKEIVGWADDARTDELRQISWVISVKKLRPTVDIESIREVCEKFKDVPHILGPTLISFFLGECSHIYDDSNECALCAHDALADS